MSFGGTVPDCICECGGQTKGGEFLPGHDARYKSALLKRYIENDDSEALMILTRRKWTKFIEASKRQAKIKAERAEKAKVRVHRQLVEDDPQAVYDRILVMKAAGEVLRQSGQYSRRSRNYYPMTCMADAMVIVAGEHENVLLEVTPEVWEAIPTMFMDAVRRRVDDPEVRELGLDFDPLKDWLNV